MKAKKFKFTVHQLKWLDALESGKFKKAYGQLVELKKDEETVKGYCCLGVACEVLGKPFGIKRVAEKFSLPKHDTEDAVLPERLYKLLRLRTEEGELDNSLDILKDTAVATTLVDLNDKARWSHKKIAQYIRKNPENVFETK